MYISGTINIFVIEFACLADSLTHNSKGNIPH